MKIIKNKKEKGFSLVEVLVAISLNLLIAGMIITIASSSLRHIRTIKDHRNLYSTASFLNNQFTYWIKQGTNFEVLPANPGDQLKIRIGSSTTTIAKDLNDRITIYDGVDTEYLTDDNIKVDNLVFTKMDNSVRIALTLNTGNPTKTFSATTTVAQRN